MKLKQIAIAVAAMAAAPAFALTPSEVGGATQLWISGASAPTNSVFQGAMSLCEGMSYKDAGGVTRTNPGTLNVHLYLESTGAEPGKSSGDRVAYACKVNTFDVRAGSLENTNVVIYHTVEGGSFNAYSPALKKFGDTNANLPTTLQRISEVADLGGVGKCAAGAATNMILTVSGIKNNDADNNNVPDGPGIARWNSCSNAATGKTTVTLATSSTAASVDVAGDTAPTISVGGFSDTEYLINKLNLDVATDVTSIGTTANTNIGQAFGVAVSYPLYAQLQKNDGIITTIGTPLDPVTGLPVVEPCDNVYTAGPCQPSMPAWQYTAAANVASAGSVNASLFGGLATGKVNLVRRAITSGTQSASNLRFLSTPCAKGVPGGAQDPTRASNSTATLVVTEQSGTGGVKSTLNTATGAGEFGMGVVSMENVPAPTSSADRWAFVKLDGVSPNSDSFQRANAIKGDYTMWYELEVFTDNNAPTAGVDLLSSINASLGNPELTNLTGLFITVLANVSGSNVSKATRHGNSCEQANKL